MIIRAVSLFSLVDSHLSAWDRDYRSRGRLWGGGVKGLPALPEGSRVLELGCGDGKTLEAMPGDWRIAALDISPEALRLSRRGDAALILADASRLPFREESFDAVFAFHVTGHLLLPGREALAREAARVLRSGGSLFLREFGEKDMRAGRGEEVEPGTFRRGPGILTHYFTEGEVEQLFSGLKPVSLSMHSWNMRIKGRDLLRSEIQAIFIKS